MTTVALAAHAPRGIVKEALQHVYVNRIVSELQIGYSQAHVT